MIRRLLTAACLTACCLSAQFSLMLVQDGSEVPVPDQFGFGTLSLGDHRDVPFRLRNTSSSAANITVFALAGVADFSFLNPPAVGTSIASGSAVDFQIRFQPSVAGTSSANFTADGVSVIFFGSALAAAQVSVDGGSGAPQPLLADATIDFGRIVRGATAARHVKLSNPSSDSLTVQNIAVAGSSFQLKGPALPLPLAPGASASIEIDFTPITDGPQQGALEIDQRRFSLTGIGLDPPFPQPEISIDLPAVQSAQQGQLTVRLPQASQATGTGHVQIDFHPSVPAVDDNGIQFLSTGNKVALFTVNQGDTVGHFGGQDSIGFQTGTTAGDIIFTVTFDNSDVTAQTTLTIPPVIISVDSTTAQRTSAGLDLRINGFDNTHSASQLTFRFYDLNGNLLNPGAIVVNASNSFAEFFNASDLGGVFALHAFFPVNGDPGQVGSFALEMANGQGASQTQRVNFTTP